MPRSFNQKLKILYIMQILQERTESGSSYIRKRHYFCAGVLWDQCGEEDGL